MDNIISKNTKENDELGDMPTFCDGSTCKISYEESNDDDNNDDNNDNNNNDNRPFANRECVQNQRLTFEKSFDEENDNGKITTKPPYFNN